MEIVVVVAVVVAAAVVVVAAAVVLTLKGAIQDFCILNSPNCTTNCLQHVHSSGQGEIDCKSRATHWALIACNNPCAALYEGKPLTDEEGEETGVHGRNLSTTIFRKCHLEVLKPEN